MSLEDEVAALRAENLRLKQQNSELHPEQRAQMDGALNRVAMSARREASQYQMIQSQGLGANIGQPSEAAYQAADYILDLFL
jgi:hypothetical protein